MTLETNQNKSEPPISHRYGWQITEASFPLVVISIVLERAITGLFFHLESNPVVIELGLFRWYAITAVCLGVLAWIFYVVGMWRYKAVIVYNYLVALFHLSVVVSNLLVVY